jgi:hypothetical protein
MNTFIYGKRSKAIRQYIKKQLLEYNKPLTLLAVFSSCEDKYEDVFEKYKEKENVCLCYPQVEKNWYGEKINHIYKLLDKMNCAQYKELKLNFIIVIEELLLHDLNSINTLLWYGKHYNCRVYITGRRNIINNTRLGDKINQFIEF